MSSYLGRVNEFSGMEFLFGENEFTFGGIKFVCGGGVNSHSDQFTFREGVSSVLPAEGNE